MTAILRRDNNATGLILYMAATRPESSGSAIYVGNIGVT